MLFLYTPRAIIDNHKFRLQYFQHSSLSSSCILSLSSRSDFNFRLLRFYCKRLCGLSEAKTLWNLSARKFFWIVLVAFQIFCPELEVFTKFQHSELLTSLNVRLIFEKIASLISINCEKNRTPYCIRNYLRFKRFQIPRYYWYFSNFFACSLKPVISPTW